MLAAYFEEFEADPDTDFGWREVSGTLDPMEPDFREKLLIEAREKARGRESFRGLGASPRKAGRKAT